MAQALDPNWVLAGFAIASGLTGTVSWLLASRKHLIEAARTKGVAEGETKALAEQQRAATTRMFEHLERSKERIERLERIVQQQREVLIREGFMVPSDTQTGAPNPLFRKG